jgi:hypothetical protein
VPSSRATFLCTQGLAGGLTTSTVVDDFNSCASDIGTDCLSLFLFLLREITTVFCMVPNDPKIVRYVVLLPCLNDLDHASGRA